MRAVPWVLITAAMLVACGGHSAAPSTAPTPAARPAGAPAAPVNTIQYGPGSNRYRVQQTVNTHQEAMGNVTDFNITANLVVTATATPMAGNMDVAYTVDSITMTSTAGAGPSLDSLRGKTFHTVMTPQGQFVSATSPDSSMATLQLRDMFREFVPSVPQGPLSDGQSWTDTVSAPATRNGGMTVRTSAVRTHHVVGWETHDGQRAVHIASTAATTLNGEGEQNGTPLTLAGHGVATADRYVAANGVYLGATTSDSTSIAVTVVTMGMDIPIRQVRHTTVTRLQ